MSVNLSPLGGAAQQFFDNNGVILSGGKLYTYAAGTTTPATTYTSSTGGTAHANPIILDSAGRVPGGEIWLSNSASYKFVLNTSLDVTLGTYDNLSGAAAAVDFYGPNGASNIGTLSGGTVQSFINSPSAALMTATVFDVAENYRMSNVTPGSSLGALFVQNKTALRRCEIQLAPTYQAGGPFDIAGAEYTLWGRDPKTGPGTADNTSFTIRSRCNTTTGAVESWDFFSFKLGTDADAPMRWGNDAQGYVMELSASTGKLNNRLGFRAGDAAGGFSPSNNVPLFAAAGDQPAYDWEERTTDGVTLLYNWRARLVGGNWSLYNLTAGTVPFQINSTGKIFAPYVDTKIITGGNYTPNLWMDSGDGQIYRTGWSKVTANANATDLASAISLVNQIKATLISYGIMV